MLSIVIFTYIGATLMHELRTSCS